MINDEADPSDVHVPELDQHIATPEVATEAAMPAVITEADMAKVATLARQERARGRSFVEFEIEAAPSRALFVRQVRLWAGLIGDVVGRVYEQGPSGGQIITRFRVRANVISILEAQRALAATEERQYIRK